MGTIKIIGFDEQGQAQRLKIRIARILDYDPVTSTEKENIRETLGVDDSLSGAFTTDLTTTQKLGAGTASPSHPLEVAGTNGSFSIAADGNTANFSRNAANYIAATADTSSSLSMLAKHSFQVHTGNPTTERMRIKSDGKFAYGHSSPNAEFSIKGDTEFLDGDTGTRIGLLYDNGTEGIFELRDNNTTKVNLRSAGDSYFNGGNVGLGLSTPLELLHLNASGGGANNRVLSRAHYGSQYADHALVLGYCAKADTAANAQMVVTESSGTGSTGNPAAIRMKTGAIEFHTANAGTSGAAFSSPRWTINSSGNLVANGTAIDFGSTSDGSGTMSSELLDDYEEGTWSPAFSMTGGDFTTAPTMDIISARYVKVGHMVTFYAYLRTDSVDITGAGGSLAVEGLPYANAGSNNYAAINVGQANFWTNAPSGGYVYSGGDYIVLTKRNTGITGSMTEMQAADLTAGVTANQNQLMISGSYFSF